MWTPWVSSPTTPRHRSFTTCSSFKDIDKLLQDEQQKHKRLILRISTSFLRALSDPNPTKPQSITNASVIIYFTSLRVVRRTFDDCRTVRSILRTFRVPIEERDVSMDSAFLEQLQEMFGTKKVSLPRVFVGEKYLGGAEEVRQLHECGELKKMVGVGSCKEWCCKVCDGHRFVVCEKCDGSHKVYVEKSGFRSCGNCNLNGLIRCPSCFSSHK